MADVFISYVEEDSSIAFKIAAGIESAQYSTWLYERDILPGLSYLVQTGDAIKACQAFLLIITPNSIGSNQIGVEVVRAFEEIKPFFPLRHILSHAELQHRQPEWRQAIGSSASIAIDLNDVQETINRIINGLRSLSIQPFQTFKSEQIQNPVLVAKAVNYDVFISGHSRHLEFINRMVEYLQDRGIKVFASSAFDSAFGDFALKIDLALDSAKTLVVILGKESEGGGPWVEYEWLSFHNEIMTGRKHKGAIISVLLDVESANLPRPLRMYQSIQYIPNQANKIFDLLARVIINGQEEGQ